MPYQPIEDYGVIGNMRTVALVGIDGSIDWFCYPRFDSPSVFAAILDDKKGGRFCISPVDEGFKSKQLYWPETNVLITRFLSEAGVAEVADFMPVDTDDPEHGDQLIREVRVPRGAVELELVCEPAFDYARQAHETDITAHGAVFRSASVRMGLAAEIPLKRSKHGARCRFTLREGESTTFVFRQLEQDADCGSVLDAVEGRRLFEKTVRFWRGWISKSQYRGRWREMVDRSALTLKLLTYEPTGAIVAAPTCSLPEDIGGVRNWDYRYTWIRDAAFTLYAFFRLGFTEEAAAFMGWLDARYRESDGNGPLQIMYGIDGRHTLVEETLSHLEGYRGSKPVRVGNAAFDQLQLDIYGELLDSVYLNDKYGRPISHEGWGRLQQLLNWLAENWQRPDEGIWEVRGGRRHFVYSRLMSWVAFDRGLRLARKRSLPVDHDRWRSVRDAIYEEIMEKGWSEERQSFIQYYGGDKLDASNLIMPLVFFMSPTDPRMLKTIDALNRSPREGGLVSDGMVYRYDTEHDIDGIVGGEGTFNMCTFWLVEALTRAGRRDRRRLDEAQLLFERMLGYANHLGLYAEETGPSGEALGNYPQAFTHLSLISAAFNLNRELER